MVRKIISLIIGFYILVFLQTSFLVHFEILGIIPNFILIALILINLLERPERRLGIAAGFLGGLFLDIFSINSGFFFGFYTLISFLISLFIKYILKKHVKIPAFQKER